MAHNAINKLGTLIVFIFISINLFGQQTEPVFVYRDSTNKRLSRLDYFISSYDRVKLDDCLFASGTFKFKIQQNGKICNLEVTGNLPDSLICSIRKRILQTERRWTFQKEQSESKWFIYPVFVDRQIGSCKDNPTIRETYDWLNKLFDKTGKPIETLNSYLLYPLYIWGVN